MSECRTVGESVTMYCIIAGATAIETQSDKAGIFHPFMDVVRNTVCLRGWLLALVATTPQVPKDLAKHFLPGGGRDFKMSHPRTCCGNVAPRGDLCLHRTYAPTGSYSDGGAARRSVGFDSLSLFDVDSSTSAPGH